MIRLATLALILATLAPAQAHEMVRGVAGVVDGDTIAIGAVKIRLEGIDAPEGGQTCTDATGNPYLCGRAATDHLISLTRNKPMTCAILGRDRYKRSLGTCTVDGTAESVNALMARAGHAWAFVRHSTQYLPQEAEAREARRGIWSGQAEPAWEYRARRRAQFALKRAAQDAKE